MQRNPSGARSLEEGMEETLTIHRLHVGSILRDTLGSTNPIESAFSIVEQVCSNVKRWQGGDQYLRWVGSGQLFAESRFNRIRGYRQIPFLVKELELTILKVAARAIRADVACAAAFTVQQFSGHSRFSMHDSWLISSVFSIC